MGSVNICLARVMVQTLKIIHRKNCKMLKILLQALLISVMHLNLICFLVLYLTTQFLFINAVL